MQTSAEKIFVRLEGLLTIAYTLIKLLFGGIFMSSGLMTGKRGLIMGLANEKSIAWGIAQACFEAGADMAFSYQGEALKKRVGPLAEKVGSDFLIECDVSDLSLIHI